MADTAEAVDQVLRLDPDALALQFEGGWSTYGAVANHIDQVRDALRAAGVRPGMLVATVLPNRPEGLVALLAVLLERACLVTISPRRAAEELTVAPATAALVGPVGAVEALAGAVGSTDVAVAAVAARDAAAPEHAGVAVLMSTSGTTGTPKRIPIRHTTIDGVVAGVRGTAGRQDGGMSGIAAPRLRDDTTLICFPYTSLSGLLPQLIALVSGRRTALVERFDPWGGGRARQ